MYNNYLLNGDSENKAAISINEWIVKLTDDINNNGLDSVQTVAGLCAAIQAVCMAEKDEKLGLSIYKQAIEKLTINNHGQNYFDFFAHAVEYNKALINNGVKGTKLDKHLSLIGFFKNG